ncbi:hypothetical protein D3C81_1579330 [compost metagenome]
MYSVSRNRQKWIGLWPCLTILLPSPRIHCRNSGRKPVFSTSCSENARFLSLASKTTIQLMKEVVYGVTLDGIHSSHSGMWMPPNGFFGMRAR